jgi:hypothetical protein
MIRNRSIDAQQTRIMDSNKFILIVQRRITLTEDLERILDCHGENATTRRLKKTRIHPIPLTQSHFSIHQSCLLRKPSSSPSPRMQVWSLTVLSLLCEILVKTVSVALNPTDWKHVEFLSPPDVLIGCD